jgi:putative nucleotidyltransferase with HDIG domain
MGTFSEELLAVVAQPAAAEQVLRLVSDPAAPADALTLVIDADPALAARVLRLANSPYYGVPRRVSSIGHAVSLLGRDTVRGIAASAACSVLAGPTDLGPDGFWRHSVSTAAACSAIAERVGYSTADAFSVGLLHDLGAMLLHLRDADAFAAAQHKPTNAAIAAAELEAFGMTHAQAGAAALEAWAFPAAFVEAVALHQHGLEPPVYSLGHILRAGEALALAHYGVPGHPTEPRLDRLLAAVSLTTAALDALHAGIETQLERLVDALTAGVGAP